MLEGHAAKEVGLATRFGNLSDGGILKSTVTSATLPVVTKQRFGAAENQMSSHVHKLEDHFSSAPNSCPSTGSFHSSALSSGLPCCGVASLHFTRFPLGSRPSVEGRYVASRFRGIREHNTRPVGIQPCEHSACGDRRSRRCADILPGLTPPRAFDGRYCSTMSRSLSASYAIRPVCC